MPAAIGAAILAGVGIADTTIIGGVTLSAVVGDITLTAALVGAQYLIQQLQSSTSQFITINQALAPRVRIYGRTMVGGVRAFMNVRNGNLYQIIMLASDQIDGFEQFFVGDEGVAVINNLVETAPWGRSATSSYIGIETLTGAPTQGQSATILGAFPELGPNFLLSGIAYAAIAMIGASSTNVQDVYPQGYNTQFRFIVRGARVYDPRNSAMSPTDKTTWAWSENAALCILDYLKHPDGGRIPLSMIDLASFSAFATVCDIPVPLKAGGTEPQYRIDGTYNMSELPKDVLRRMCDACDAQLILSPTTGLIGIRGGQWVAPTVSIASQNTLAAQWQQGAGAFDAYNRLTASFSYPPNYYNLTELAPLNDTASQAIVGEIPQTLPLSMVTSYTQAARLAKIALAKANPLWKGKTTVNCTGLNAVAEQFINVEYTPVPGTTPLVSGTFMVTSTKISPSLESVELGLSYLTSDVYAWNPATEEPDAPATPYTISQYNVINPPTDVHVVLALQTISSGTSGIVGTMTWDASARLDTEPVAQYSVNGANAWQSMTLNPNGVAATTPFLQDGTAYDFQVQYTVGSAASTWSQVIDVVAEVPSSPPVSITASISGTTISLVALSPDSSNFYSIQFYVGTTNVFSAASMLGTAVVGAQNSYVDQSDTASGHGTKYYWATSKTAAGTESAPAGPTAITF